MGLHVLHDGACIEEAACKCSFKDFHAATPIFHKLCQLHPFSSSKWQY